MAKNFRSQLISDDLLLEITKSLEEVGGWGSVEIFIQDFKVTQITKRAIRKTNHSLPLDNA